MFDLQHFPGQWNNARSQVFIGSQTTTGTIGQTWVKPKGANWVHLFLVGKGGNGGNGAIGANSAAAGGGGGGSGAQSSVIIPAWCLPDTLYLSLAGVGPTSAVNSYVGGSSNTVSSSAVIQASGGGNGGNASGATAGAAGAAGAVSTNITGWFSSCGAGSYVAGQAGIIGGVAVSGGALTVTLGLRVTGGTGGGGLPAAAATGTTGGAISASQMLPGIAAAAGQATATSPPNAPDSGFIFNPVIPGVVGYINYGGLGSGSTHGTATGGGLVQVRGGDGAPGCGGGGSGGALTGSTSATGGNGGPAFCIITCW